MYRPISCWQTKTLAFIAAVVAVVARDAAPAAAYPGPDLTTRGVASYPAATSAKSAPATETDMDVQLINATSMKVRYATEWCDANTNNVFLEDIEDWTLCTMPGQEVRTLPGNATADVDMDGMRFDANCVTTVYVDYVIFAGRSETRDRRGVGSVWVNYEYSSADEPDFVEDVTITSKICYGPEYFTASNITYSSVTLSWAPISGTGTGRTPVSYTLQREVSSGSGVWTTLTSGFISHIFAQSGLSPNTRYVFRVRHERMGNLSEWKAIELETTPRPLPPPVTGCTYRITGTYLYAGHYDGVTTEAYSNAAAAREAQCLLNAWGNYNAGRVDGQWGPQSRSAAQAFQNHMRNSHGATVAADGFVGPQTWPLLRSHQVSPH